MTPLAFKSTAAIANAALPALMPQPAEVRPVDGRLPIEATFSVALRGHDDARLRSGITRALLRWEARTGFTFKRTPENELVFASDAAVATLVVDCANSGAALPTLGEDEAYTLTVDAKHAVLRAPNVVGALRGLETWLQLLQADAGAWFVPALTIEDRPRFPWRGLMIDVARHWQPMAVIKRNLDGMALVKLNVLHLHLTEDQGFRIESKTHPELQQRGSDGKFFTQDEMREIIAYAAERGIRVVPEFDMPGHATSWVVSHPELASAPGPYVLQRKWGVFDPVLDPTNEKVYALLDDFLGEMAALFPDPYLHIGGDENNGVHWKANAAIQAYIGEHNLKDNAGLHAYFNQRVHAILTKHGKRMVGWDEILHPNLPKDSIVHSWRGPAGLADAAGRGFGTILSNGYYIDLCYHAAQHYLNDPIPAGTPMTADQQAHVLGGEATMWAEWVTPETIDSRIWPRTAAIAERLWSARDVNNVPDMYRRLAVVSQRLEEAGLNHERNRPAMIRQLAGDRATESEIASLTAFVDAIEPVKEYARNRFHKDYTQASPLTSLADCARPESDVAREFTVAVQAALKQANGGKLSAAQRQPLEQQLLAWIDAGSETAVLLETRAPRGREGAPVARSLADASAVGMAALDALTSGAKRDSTWKQTQLATLERAAVPHDAVELPMMAAIRDLVNAAAAAR